MRSLPSGAQILKCVVGSRVRIGNKKAEQLYEMNLDHGNECEGNKRRWYRSMSCGGIQELWSGRDSPRRGPGRPEG